MPRSLAQAEKWYSRAADQGSAWARLRLDGLVATREAAAATAMAAAEVEAVAAAAAAAAGARVHEETSETVAAPRAEKPLMR